MKRGKGQSQPKQGGCPDNFPEMLKLLEPQIKWKVALKDESRSVYRPMNGHFEEISQAVCKMEVRRYFKRITPALIASLMTALQEDAERLFDDSLFLESRKRIVGFLNGCFDLRTGKVRAYGASDFVVDPLPHRVVVEVNPDIEPWFLRILTQWVGEDCAEWFLDLLAYLLFIYPNDEQVWVDFFGIGSNGKSVCEELLERILGDKKCIGCDLANVNRFSGDTFQSKWLVIGRDSSSFANEKATSFIKNFSGDTKFLVEEKGGSSYDVYNTGKLIVSTNTLIQSKDRTYAWYRRILPVPFPNIFTQDESFKHKLFQRLPQIIRLLLHRAYLYRCNKTPLKRYLPPTVRDLMQETRYLNDRVTAFWELEFFKEEEKLGLRSRVVDFEKLKFLHGKSISEVYFYFAGWSEQEFGEGNVEPSLKTFGGPYGAFLQSDAGKYFRYKRTNNARILELLPEYWEKAGIKEGVV